jgi:ubiquinone/menaquinone biosynthesis C-methylase UbiE
MSRPRFLAAGVCLLLVLPATSSGQRPERLIRQEQEQAKRDVPKLADALSLKPGMTVADVGSGGGSMAVGMATWLGPSGRVYATDVGAAQLAEITSAVARDGLTNVTVLEGAAGSTNLPNDCCDAIFLRAVYHHLTSPPEFGASLLASLKSGGRLAIIDFEPPPGSSVPEGVPKNREGHGIRPPVIVSELTQSGFRHATTLSRWPGDRADDGFLVLFEKP